MKTKLTHSISKDELNSFLQHNLFVKGNAGKLFMTGNIVRSCTKYTETDFVKQFFYPTVRALLENYLSQFITPTRVTDAYKRKSRTFLFLFFDFQLTKERTSTLGRPRQQMVSVLSKIRRNIIRKNFH